MGVIPNNLCKILAITISLSLPSVSLAFGGYNIEPVQQGGILIGNAGAIIQSKQQAMATLIGQWQIIKTSDNSRYANVQPTDFFDIRYGNATTVLNIKRQYPQDAELGRSFQRLWNQKDGILTAMCVGLWGGHDMSMESFVAYDNYQEMMIQEHLYEYSVLQERGRDYRKQCVESYRDNSLMFITRADNSYGIKKHSLFPVYRFYEDMLGTFKNEVQTNLYIKHRLNGFDMMKSVDVRLGDDIAIDIVDNNHVIVYDFLRGSKAGGWAYFQRVGLNRLMSRNYSLRMNHNQQKRPLNITGKVGSIEHEKERYQGVFN